jgi:hypothetical protein
MEACIGLNCCPRIIDAMRYVNTEILAEVEVKGKIIKENDKWTCEKMKLIKTFKWDKIDSVALSIYAAELCIKNYEKVYPKDDRPRKAIEAAKKWLSEPTEENRSVAKSVAKSAESAAWSAWSVAKSEKTLDRIEKWILKRLGVI